MDKRYFKAPLLNETQAAELLGMTTSTLQQWRYYGYGPSYVKIGRSVRYRPEDLETFIKDNLKSPSDEIGY